MRSILNKRILKLIPIIFLIIIIFRIMYDYNSLIENERNFAKKEAEVLNSFAMSHRNYYQKLFINKTIALNEKTLKALPAYAYNPISTIFSKDNPLHITLRTVSDRARNHLNSADKDELKAIDFFKKNKDENDYFSSENEQYYQYASALRIDNKCMLCHGKREDAPKFIRDTYAKSYDYKIGEVRGIMSIKVPTKSVEKYFKSNFIESIVYDILLLIALFLGISYLTRKSKSINKILTKEIKAKTSELKATFVVDKLTNLPNRRKLLEDISINTQSSHRHLALLNIDDFTDINDFYGHDIGDKILKEFALLFLSSCPCKDSKVYKLPSDEIAVYLTTEKTIEEFIKNITNVIKTINKHEFIIDNNEIFITVSAGVSSDELALTTTADIALKRAKIENKNLVFYDNSLNISEKIIENRENLKLLKDAIKADNIVPFFQAIYNTHTKKVEKYECLVRIVQDDGTIIPPYKFLGVALKSKHYLYITKVMITKSFEFFKDKEYEFSINLSIIDMTNSDMLEFITTALENFSDPHRVVFEILENDNLGDYEEIRNFIKIIKKFGCQFAIDDFGSGYSNFSHVHELNVDFLKIDASLIKYIATDENSRIITKTIIHFAKNIGLKTIAEYVEDIESFELLEKMGIDYIQGYYIGKPNPDIPSHS